MLETGAQNGTSAPSGATGGLFYLIITCNEGDIPITGGFGVMPNREFEIKDSRPLFGSDNPYTSAVVESLDGWIVVVRKRSNSTDTFSAWVLCATTQGQEDDSEP